MRSRRSSSPAARTTPTGGGGSGASRRGSELVERRTLVDSATVDGTLGYGASRPALDRRGGTLTWLPRTGATIHPGERIFEVDGDPVILMDGTTPAWRTLQRGDEGADVLQLERNLAALGHDPGTVDENYTVGDGRCRARLAGRAGGWRRPVAWSSATSSSCRARGGCRS